MIDNSMHMAHDLFKKALSSGREGNAAEERAAYDEIISRFSGHEDPEVRRQVAKALLNKGTAFGRQGKTADERAVYDEIVRQLGDAPETGLKVQVAKALLNKAMTFARQMQSAIYNLLDSAYLQRYMQFLQKY